MFGLGDDEVAALANNPHRLTAYERVFRLDVGFIEWHETAFGLRHDLLGDHDAVTVEQWCVVCTRGVGDMNRNLIAATNFCDAGDGNDSKLGHYATAFRTADANAAEIPGLRIMVSVTTARTPSAST